MRANACARHGGRQAHCKRKGPSGFRSSGVQVAKATGLEDDAEVRDGAAFAVIASGGKQHRVTVGETVRLERLPEALGDEVAFADVLMVAAGANVLIGQPHVDGAVVRGAVVGRGQGKKIRVIKFKRRKNYLRRKGHRQLFCDVRITAIDCPALAAAAAESAQSEADEEAGAAASPAEAA